MPINKNMTSEELLSADNGFSEWVKVQAANPGVDHFDHNVYALFKRWAWMHLKCHIEVGPDWISFEPRNEYSYQQSMSGVWINSSKLPRWFNEWVRQNGSGIHGIEYRLGAAA